LTVPSVAVNVDDKCMGMRGKKQGGGDMFPIDKGEILSKIVGVYELSRLDENLFIQVCRMLTGRKAGAYNAYIYVDGTLCGSFYWGYGSTEMRALRDCLLKTRDVPTRDIIDDRLETSRVPQSV